MPKLFVVSDIHGYYDEMKKTLDEAGFDRMKLNFAIVITAHNRAYDINSYRTIVIKKYFVDFSFDVIESCINTRSVLC